MNKNCVKAITLICISFYTLTLNSQDLKQLSSVLSWKDNNTLLFTRLEKDKRIYQEYNITNRQFAEVAKPVEEAKAGVMVKEGDIYYISASGTETKITETKSEEKNPELSPDGKLVAFTRDNDLYSVSIDGTNEKRYTNDGTDLILNGWASWVYYEEILGRASRYRAFWWSPDSKSIAFMRFDDSKVPMFPIYEPSGEHGSVVRTRYPKA